MDYAELSTVELKAMIVDTMKLYEQVKDHPIMGLSMGSRVMVLQGELIKKQEDRLKEPESKLTNERQPLSLSNAKLWEMAALIVEKMQVVATTNTGIVGWDLLTEEWFDWLEESVYGEQEEPAINPIC